MATSVAQVFVPNKGFDLQEIPLPLPSEGEALVQVTACTICGSDLHSFFGRRPVSGSTILGHEILGTVQQVQGDVRDYHGNPVHVGNRIVWSVCVSCGKCSRCRDDLPQKCHSLLKYGHTPLTGNRGLHGGMASHCHLLAGTAIFPVPKGLADSVVCPSSCATATVAAAHRYAGPLQGKRVLVQGIGMLGLTACAFSAVNGAAAVFAWDLSPERTQLAKRFGTTRAIQIESGMISSDILKETGGPVDVIFEMTGSHKAIQQGLELLDVGGRCILVGSVFPTAPVDIDPEKIVRNYWQILGVHNYHPRDLAAALVFLENNHSRFPFAELVGPNFPLANAKKAFEIAELNKPIRIKIDPDH